MQKLLATILAMLFNVSATVWASDCSSKFNPPPSPYTASMSYFPSAGEELLDGYLKTNCGPLEFLFWPPGESFTGIIFPTARGYKGRETVELFCKLARKDLNRVVCSLDSNGPVDLEYSWHPELENLPYQSDVPGEIWFSDRLLKMATYAQSGDCQHDAMRLRFKRN